MFLIITCFIFHMPWWVWVTGVLQIMLNTTAWLLVYSTITEIWKTQKTMHVMLIRSHAINQALLQWTEEVTVEDAPKTESEETQNEGTTDTDSVQ